MARKHITLPRLTPQEIRRFWSRVRKLDADKCWPWTRARNKEGYGSFKLGLQNHGAHRIAYLLTYGPFPPELFVMHTCDNPGCCNPAHLRAGTHSDNMRDKVRKGRSSGAGPKGEAQGNAKLTSEDVRSIRRRHTPGRGTKALAKEFNVGVRMIQHVVARHYWKHIS